MVQVKCISLLNLSIHVYNVRAKQKPSLVFIPPILELMINTALSSRCSLLFLLHNIGPAYSPADNEHCRCTSNG